MVLLSEKPEYNKKLYAASLLSPVGYLKHVDSLWKVMAGLGELLSVIFFSTIFINAIFIT